MSELKMKTKSGAASFYVVAFSTLILVIIAASFATAIIAEMARTANDDLSQSAYDAAMAGVEDAKLAFMNYQNCLKRGETIDDLYSPSENEPITCKDIIYWANHQDCDTVGRILGRIGKGDSGEVLIEETTSTNGSGSTNQMNQAYTCVTFETNLRSFEQNLSSTTSYRVIKVQLEEDTYASDIKAARISWFRGYDEDGETLNFNYNNFDTSNNKVIFRPVNAGVAMPPTIAVQLVQTAKTFSLEQLNGKSEGNKTDRATMYLVPIEETNSGAPSGYINAYSEENGNMITAQQVADTNDHGENLPFGVRCSENAPLFACEAVIELPEPIGGVRSDDTFIFVVSLPYGDELGTNFSLELCKDGSDCWKANSEEIHTESKGEVALQSGMQVEIDSTGRANDLYRRVEVLFDNESSSASSAFPFYAVELLEKDPSKTALEKNLTVTTEWNFKN